MWNSLHLYVNVLLSDGFVVVVVPSYNRSPKREGINCSLCVYRSGKTSFWRNKFWPVGKKLEQRPKLYWPWPCLLFTQLWEGQCGLRNLPSYFLVFGFPWCWSAGKQSLICSKQLLWMRFSFQVFLLEMTSGLWGRKNMKLWFRKIVTQAFVEKAPNTLFPCKRRKIILYDQNV